MLSIAPLQAKAQFICVPKGELQPALTPSSPIHFAALYLILQTGLHNWMELQMFYPGSFQRRWAGVVWAIHYVHCHPPCHSVVSVRKNDKFVYFLFFFLSLYFIIIRVFIITDLNTFLLENIELISLYINSISLIWSVQSRLWKCLSFSCIYHLYWK